MADIEGLADVGHQRTATGNRRPVKVLRRVDLVAVCNGNRLPAVVDGVAHALTGGSVSSVDGSPAAGPRRLVDTVTLIPGVKRIGRVCGQAAECGAALPVGGRTAAGALYIAVLHASDTARHGVQRDAVGRGHALGWGGWSFVLAQPVTFRRNRAVAFDGSVYGQGAVDRQCAVYGQGYVIVDGEGFAILNREGVVRRNGKVLGGGDI